MGACGSRPCDAGASGKREDSSYAQAQTQCPHPLLQRGSGGLNEACQLAPHEGQPALPPGSQLGPAIGSLGIEIRTLAMTDSGARQGQESGEGSLQLSPTMVRAGGAWAWPAHVGPFHCTNELGTGGFDWWPVNRAWVPCHLHIAIMHVDSYHAAPCVSACP